MDFKARVLTDVGQKRDHNEDYALYDKELNLMVVCDGMGGHAAGEVASEMAAQEIKRTIAENQDLFKLFEKDSGLSNKNRVIQTLKKAVKNANEKIWNHARQDESKKGMGTTAVVSLILEDHIFIAHVGDSRAYLFRNGEVHQITEDHSFVNELLNNGIISAEQAKTHPQRNVITRAIGIAQVVEADVISMEVMDGDSYLICSDGLTGYMNKKGIKAYHERFNFQELCENLIAFANRQGGKDNITVGSILIGQEGGPPIHPEAVTVDKKIAIIKKVPLFKAFNFKEIQRLLEVSEIRKFKTGETVIHEGMIGDEMYIILKGEANVSNKGNELAVLCSGDYFGEMSLIDKNPRNATITIGSDVQAIEIKRGNLFPLIKKESRIGLKLFWAFLQRMNKRLREADKKWAETFQHLGEVEEMLAGIPDDDLGFVADEVEDIPKIMENEEGEALKTEDQIVLDLSALDK